MQFMQVSDREWSDLKDAIRAGSAPVGACLVSGPSEEIAVQAQAVLMVAAQQKYRVRYFLCSDSGIFRVPCFLPLTGKEVLPEPFDASRYLLKRLRAEGLIVRKIMGRTLRELEHSALSEAPDAQLVVIEYLTPPSTLDLTFTLQSLKSAVSRNIPLIMLCHQQPVSDQLAWQSNDTLEDILSMLYLCGGHMRQADWLNIIELLSVKDLCERFTSTRRVGGDTWVCYANSQVAGMAEKVFQGMEPARRCALAQAVLQRLPRDSSGYPLLAIAAETHDLKAMLAVYSHEAAETALAEPKALVRYFERLRQVAQMAGDTTTTDRAYLLSLYAQVYLNKTRAVQAYQKLRGRLAWYYRSGNGNDLLVYAS